MVSPLPMVIALDCCFSSPSRPHIQPEYSLTCFDLIKMAFPVLVLCAYQSTVVMLSNILAPRLRPQFCPLPGRILP